MIHPHTELRFIHADIGHGVFATQAIPRGTVTWVLDPLDRQFTLAQLQALPATLKFDALRHTFLGRDGRYVMPWDLASFVNHHCEPNCLATEHGFEVAIRDIAAGEQLTNDYVNLGLHPGERFDCYCGASRCRGHVQQSDRLALELGWHAAVAQALEQSPRVEQPLVGLLSEQQSGVLMGGVPVRKGRGRAGKVRAMVE